MGMVPRGHDNTQTVFTPYVPADPTATALDVSRTTNAVQDPHHHGSAPAIHCSQSQYGCCPDGRIAAGGLRGLGCPRAPATPPATAAVEPTAAVQPAGTCARTSHGCCRDGVTSARGPDKEGCREYVAAVPTASAAAASLPTTNAQQCRTTTYGCCYDRTTPAAGPSGEGCPDPPGNLARSMCSLPRAAGSCADWSARFHYDVVNARCVHFWYGNCHGNRNNFMTRSECQRACPSVPVVSVPVPVPAQPAPGPASVPASRGGSGRGSSSSATSTSEGSVPAVAPRQGVNAATHAHRARNHMRFRHPAHGPAYGTAAQSAGLAASLTLGGGVAIDQSDPSAVEALVGQTAVLPCRVSPPPSSTSTSTSVSVEWRRDGDALSTRRILSSSSLRV
ncbi:hypothetical protein CRUP_004593 [Coryphaenoides rupestris]|nr:hypothetical protein CRUP_004593 [Coryphaenoides rupestris]